MSQEQNSLNMHKYYKINPSLNIPTSGTTVTNGEKNHLGGTSAQQRAEFISSSIIDVTNSTNNSPNTNFQNQLIFLVPPPVDQPNSSPGSMFQPRTVITAPSSAKDTTANPSVLYVNKRCAWPNCAMTKANKNLSFETFESYQREHLNLIHRLNDLSKKDLLSQINRVTQLELELQRNRSMLSEMLTHLNNKLVQESIVSVGNLNNLGKTQFDETSATNGDNSVSNETGQKQSASNKENVVAYRDEIVVTTENAGESRQAKESKNRPGSVLNEDFELNRNFYRTSNTRPPYTYVSLIRQAIIESPHRQLPTTDILDWFENNFQFFRNNTVSLAWESAVRNTLSGQKCFTRIKTGTSGVWTVVDSEYFKNRLARNSTSSPNSEASQPSSPAPNQDTSSAEVRPPHSSFRSSLNNWAQSSMGASAAGDSLNTASGQQHVNGVDLNKRKMMFEENEPPARKLACTTLPKAESQV